MLNLITVMLLIMFLKKKSVDPNEIKTLLEVCQRSYIYYDDPNKSINYCVLYDQSIKDCEFYTCYEKFNFENKGIVNGIEYFQKKYPSKPKIWDEVYNIGSFINNYPWTLALTGKKILILSQFSKEMAAQGNNNEIYGCNIFNNKIQCLEFMPKRVENYNSDQIMSIYMENLKQYDFDVVLIDAYGYGNILAHYVCNFMKKSAINVGELLPLYFGLYNDYYEKKYPDIIKLYKNKHWKKI